MLHYALRALATAVIAASIAFVATIAGVGLAVAADLVTPYRSDQITVTTLVSVFVVVLPWCWRWAARWIELAKP